MSRCPIKTPQEISIMRENGVVASSILSELFRNVREGITTGELNDIAEQLVTRHNVAASFKGFEGYPYSIVTCINEEVVHGMPSAHHLNSGDLLTIDFGVFSRGFHTDTAYTVEVGTSDH